MMLAKVTRTQRVGNQKDACDEYLPSKTASYYESRGMNHSKDDPEEISPPADVWWFWYAFIEDPGRERWHLYGCACKTDKPAGFNLRRSIELPSTSKLHIAQLTVTSDQTLPILDLLDGGEIDLTGLGDGAPSVSVYAEQRIMAKALGNNVTTMRCYIGQAAPAATLPEVKDIPDILTVLVEELGFDFQHKFVNHIGGFDVMDRPVWPENDAPFTITIFNANKQEPENTILIGRRDRHQTALSAHIIASNPSGDVIVNRLITMPGGVAEHRLATVQSIYGCKVSFFGEDGEALYEYDETFIRTASFNINAVVKTLQIEDRLAERAKGKGRDQTQRASHASRVVRSTSTVTADPAPAADRRAAMSNHVATAFTGASKDRWFPRTFDSELDVISYFSELLADPEIAAATFIDPYVNGATIERLLRLDCTGLTLTVLMSWTKTNADTGDTQGEQKTRADLARLKTILDLAGPHMSCNLRVRNIVGTDGEQAFHDRYLMTRAKDGETKVYLLSNSLNAMAKNWPFCLSALSGPAKSDAAKYIQELQNGKDIARETQPRTTFAWPEETASLS